MSSTFRRLRCRHAVGEAADKGQLDVLQWWLSSNYGGCQLRGAYDTIFELVIARGHYAMLDWLSHQDKIPVGNARSKCVPYDDPVIVQWLHEEGHKVPLIVKLCYADTEEDLTYMKRVLKHKRAFKRIDGLGSTLPTRETSRSSSGSTRIGRPTSRSAFSRARSPAAISRSRNGRTRVRSTNTTRA